MKKYNTVKSQSKIQIKNKLEIQTSSTPNKLYKNYHKLVSPTASNFNKEN
jgi:hypothetical protein